MTLFRIRATICPLVIKPIYIFIFLLLSNCSLCVDPHFEACSVPKSCGEIHNISYPFYIEGLQEPYCGSPYPGFKFVCDKNRTIFKLPDSDQDYFVQDISYPNQSLRVLNRNIATLQSDSNISCSPPIQNLTLEREGGFELDSGVTDLFLYFNCPDSALKKLKSNKIGCSNGGSKHTGSGLALSGSDSNLRCGQLVKVPVERSAVESRNWSDYVNMMKRGFLLKWNASDCSNCKDSGGKCGYDDTIHFSCFCPDRPHKVRCSKGNNKKELKLKVAIPGSLFVLGIASLLMFIAYRRHKKQKLESANFLSRNISSDPFSKSNLEKGGVYFGIPIFSYNDLVIATNNFDPSKELGDGGFGTIYYGKLRDGREVAVKRLYENNYKRVEQFMNEIEILTRLRHRNLVSLYGCTSRTSRELILVYEYIANGTVADHLHGDRANPSALTWPLRMNIAIETANALVYLHASDIIHRDVKTNNILLDDNFHVKVADFGLSRLFPIDVTHVSTAPQGTPGYVDPEYHQCYQLTDKSDVYSFGVVLIELISSMPAVDISRHRHEINLSNYAINKIQNHAINELVDPVLGFQTDFKVRRMTSFVAELAFRCLQSDKEMRPSMDEVLKHLIRIESEEEYEVDTNGEELKGMRSSESDEVVLLKHNQLQPSPESMTEKWNGRSTSLKHNQPPPSPEFVIDKWNSRSTIFSDSC